MDRNLYAAAVRAYARNENALPPQSRARFLHALEQRDWNEFVGGVYHSRLPEERVDALVAELFTDSVESVPGTSLPYLLLQTKQNIGRQELLVRRAVPIKTAIGEESCVEFLKCANFAHGKRWQGDVFVTLERIATETKSDAAFASALKVVEEYLPHRCWSKMYTHAYDAALDAPATKHRTPTTRVIETGDVLGDYRLREYFSQELPSETHWKLGFEVARLLEQNFQHKNETSQGFDGLLKRFAARHPKMRFVK